MPTIALYAVLLVALTPPVGAYMHHVYTREKNGRLERLMYRMLGVNPSLEQSWRRYASGVLWFSVIAMGLSYVVMRLQGHLPLNPLHLPGVGTNVAFNTAASFTTNTNWQAYGGESTMSYLSQMLALTFQQFVSAAVGMAVLVALIRGFTRGHSETVGHFWRDLVRSVFYILLPLSAVVGFILVTQGVVQTFGSSVTAHGIQGFVQTIARGPVAAMVSIKQLGTNGGGYFNVNSAHPFENATAISNFVEMFAILLIPAALTYTFGKTVGNVKQGWAIFAAMFILFAAGLAVTVPGERHATTTMQNAGVVATAPNMEGKEFRFGNDASSLWLVATTDASNGSVNSMHDSFAPLGGAVALFNLAVGEVIFGGVGSGLYGMLHYAIIAVFIGGLMVGRTPEYLGKKIGGRVVKLAMIGVLVPFLVVLGLTAIAVVTKTGLGARTNLGPHGFSEIFYAFDSMGNNNGSAFAGLTATNGLYAIGGGIAMLVGRFVPVLTTLALAGSFAREGIVPETTGTLKTDTGLFVGLLVGVIIITGALTFLPALSLGPIVESLLHHGARLF
ncbi:MAG: potassium-transporting ATPase subunit KdpA [Actinomycetota bacterium]